MEPDGNHTVVVVGGGFAGLSAAAALADRGLPVDLLERRSRLGGRAYSFSDRRTGDTVDNGQHLFMRCYRHTLDFLTRIGAADRLHFQNRLRIDFRHSQSGPSVLAFPRFLPPPFHLLAGFLRFGPLTPSDVLGLRRVAARLRDPDGPSGTVDAWLKACGQSERIRNAFWDPLCVSALNQEPGTASARHLSAVLREAFFGPRDGACLGYAGVGLSALYADPGQRFIQARGGTVRLRAAVSELSPSPGGRLRLRLRSGDALNAAAVVLAVPPPALVRLLPEAPLRGTLSAFRPSPILSVNLWLDGPAFDAGVLGLLGTRMQWAFNKPALYRGRDRASDGHLALVASAANGLVERPDPDLVDIALGDLRAAVPEARRLSLRHSLVVRERRATFALPPDVPHPGVRTHLPNLFLAGDWTDTGLPATIESAVRSGHRAADCVADFLNA